MKKTVITPSISESVSNALSARGYDSSYTPIPNINLPAEIRESLSKVFSTIQDSEMDLESSSYMVRARDGAFSGIVAPSVYRAALYEGASDEPSGLEDYLVIRWGDNLIPVNVSTEGFSFPNAREGAKIEAKLSTETTHGKFTSTCLVLTLKDTKAKEINVIQFPVRAVDYKNPIDPDVGASLIEEGDLSSFLGTISPVPNPERKLSERGSGRLEGFFVKAAALPEGEYSVTEYREKHGGKYGTEYYIQVVLDAPVEGVSISQPVDALPAFVEGASYNIGQSVLFEGAAYTASQDNLTAKPCDSSAWVIQEDSWVSNVVTLEGKAIVKPNAKMKKFFAAKPIITPEKPALMRLHSHGEYNGHPTVKADFQVESWEEGEGINLNF